MTGPRDASRLKQLEVAFEAGDLLFREGERSRELYILLSGQVEIVKNGRVIGLVTTSDTYLGEMSMLLGSRRTATLAARTPCTLIRVPEDRVLEFFRFSPELGMKLAKTLALRLWEMNGKYERLLNRTEGE